MANRKRKVSGAFLIGLFVIIGASIFVGALIWLGANKFLKEQVYYATYFDGSIEGLEAGSAVKYLGVPCGNVYKIKVAPDGKLVEVIMQLNPDVIINDSLRIKSEMAGIAGGKFLQLFYPTDPAMSILHPAINFTPTYKVIKSAPSGLEEITLAMREVMNNLMRLKVSEISDGTIEFLGATTKFFNNPDLYKTIEELSITSERLKSIATRADSSNIISNLSQTTNKLNETSVELKMFAEKLNKQVDDMKIPEYMAKIYQKYDTTMEHTNKSMNTVSYRVENMLFGLNETFEELRNTNKALQKSLKAVTDNPSQVFFSTPPPKEK